MKKEKYYLTYSWAIVIAGIFLVFFYLSIFSKFTRDPLLGAEDRIQKYRMSQATVRILDSKGVPIPFARLQIKQLQHEFFFGSTVYSYVQLSDPKERDKYFQLFSQLFNLAVIPFFWRYYEPEPGKIRYAETKELIQLFHQAGLRVLGHPLIDHSIMSNPVWLKRTDDLETLIRARLEREIEDFPEVDAWVVMNEPTLGWALFPTAAWIMKRGAVSATRLSLEWAQAKNNHSILLVNNVLSNPVLSLHSVFYHIRFIPGIVFLKKVRKPPSYLEFLKELNRTNPPDYGVGIQSHMYSYYWPLWMTDETISLYGKLGRPLFFTEISIPSGEFRIINWSQEYQTAEWPSLPEKELIQAEYVTQFYTLLFSRPEVEAIIWFDFSDKYAHLGAPVGLLRQDLSPKPAYDALHHLIREKWWTKLETRTDHRGQAQFSGFFGLYQITITTPEGKTQTFEINLKKIGPKFFTLRTEEGSVQK